MPTIPRLRAKPPYMPISILPSKQGEMALSSFAAARRIKGNMVEQRSFHISDSFSFDPLPESQIGCRKIEEAAAQGADESAHDERRFSRTVMDHHQSPILRGPSSNQACFK